MYRQSRKPQDQALKSAHAHTRIHKAVKHAFERALEKELLLDATLPKAFKVSIKVFDTSSNFSGGNA